MTDAFPVDWEKTQKLEKTYIQSFKMKIFPLNFHSNSSCYLKFQREKFDCMTANI